MRKSLFDELLEENLSLAYGLIKEHLRVPSSQSLALILRSHLELVDGLAKSGAQP